MNTRSGGKYVCIFVLVFASTFFLASRDAEAGSEKIMENTVYSFSAKTIGGQDLSLDTYRGKVLLIVNTASKCGFTGQYAGLEQLYRTHKERGFEILAFPANDFMGQEPGTNQEIQTFCRTSFDVTFSLFAKITVKGKGMHPLYQWLTGHPEFGGEITWNFNKYLIGRDGQVLARFDTRMDPQARELIQALEQALGAQPAAQ